MGTMLRWTEEQLAEHRAKQGKPAPAAKVPAAPAKPVNPKERLYALGRLKDGAMNPAEARYAEHLEALKQAGEIVWYLFEGIKLKLAPNTFFTVDFAVMTKDRQLEMLDVKGSAAVVQDDARVKVKVAASIFPFVFKFVYPRRKKDGGGWIEEVI